MNSLVLRLWPKAALQFDEIFPLEVYLEIFEEVLI